MSIQLKCAACGHEVPFEDGDLSTETICPGCEVLLRRQSLEDNMAIPVSMALPEKFGPANLDGVAKLSQELVHRYQKTSPSRIIKKSADPLSDSNLILAQAIEQLAQAIGNRGHGTIEQETVQPEHYPNETGNENYPTEQETIPILNGIETKPENAYEPALPVGSRVLVRREAAVEAHRFQRRSQSDTDIKGPQKTSFAKWIEAHPFIMMLTGLALLVALVVMTTILMNGALGETNEPEIFNAAITGEDLLEDPDFNHAEREARGFLNAISLKPARPYIFREAAIGPKLDKFFQPLSDPGNYSIELTGRQKNNNKAVYYYQVTCGDETQPLAVLQENSIFKVFWEFGACIGDISWDAFVNEEPSTPVLMRAFLKPDLSYDAAHNRTEWSSWLAENWNGSYSARVYSKIASPEDRRLKSALVEHPVEREETNWVMAQVRLKHVGTGIDRITGAFDSAEIVEVPLGSWLPKEFVSGSTFYSEKDQLDEPRNNIQGLPSRKHNSFNR